MENKKQYTLWNMMGAEAYSDFEQKEMYAQFTSMLLDSNDRTGRRLYKMWQKQLKVDNPFSKWDYLKFYGLPVIIVIVMVIAALYLNLSATLIVLCCCFAPSLLAYFWWVAGMIILGSTVMSMKQVKTKYNL